MPDQLSAVYSEFLDGGYDCVDRVICNAYFSMGQTGGGFRMWWRELHGSDDNLDDNHLMRMAGRFSRRLRAWAKANGVPVVYCAPGERKHEIAEQHLSTHEVQPGLFLVLVSRAPALVWEAQQTGTGKLGQLVPKDPWPYVNHYSLHILDPDWGHLTIKMSGHPPFGAQVILNGHEYVAAQARKGGVQFTKQENCFTSVDQAARLAKIADTLSQQEAAGRLRQLCERWIYSTCLCFALDLKEQEKSTFQYQYSVFQMEYSRNLLFRSGRQMDEIFQALIDRTRAPLDLDRIKTIFGDKNRPHYDKRKKNPERWGVVVETPTYDLTVFKVHYGKMTLKIYTKGARVLRVEVYRAQYPGVPLGPVAVLLCGDRDALARDSGAIPECGRLHGCLLRLRRNLGKPAAPDASRSNQSRRDRFQQTPNAPGGRSSSGVIDRTGRFHRLRTCPESAHHEWRGRIRLRAAAGRLRSEKAARQSNGPQDRELSTL